MKRKSLLLVLCAALCLMSVSLNVYAQAADTTQTEPKVDEINLDTQLYLIVATNQDVAESKIPPVLEPVLKQLHATLPFKNYRLAATLINRVKNEGRLDLSWISAPLATSSGVSPALTPSFSQFHLRLIKLGRDSNNQQMVQMQGFSFGARIPIQVSGAIAANGAVAPNFNYENTGLNTDISMHESEPVIVGTLNVGPSGDAIILVVSAKRTQK